MNHITPFFSIILPVYNSELFIRESIKSAINQSYKNWELIIIDDGSTDKSLHIAKHEAEKDVRIKVLQHEGGVNKGVSASRNLGIKHAKADWIALLDADDMWEKNKLEEQFKILQAYDHLAMLYCQAVRKFENYTGYEKKFIYGKGNKGLTKDPFTKKLKGFESPTSGVVFNKHVFEKTGGFDEDLAFAEDTLLFHKLLLFGNLFFLEKSLVISRFHDSSVKQTTIRATVVQARLNVYLKLLDFTEKKYHPLISFHAVTTGLEKVWIYFVRDSFQYFNVLVSSYLNIWTTKKVKFVHKIGSLFIPFRLLGLYILKRARKQLNNFSKS